MEFLDQPSLRDAQTLVWRRELDRTDGEYNPSSSPGPNKVRVEPVDARVDGFDVILAVRIGRNIDDLNGERLAELAIESARNEVGVQRRDGISYLIQAKEYGVETPLLDSYEAAIKQQLGVASLADAWKILQPST